MLDGMEKLLERAICERLEKFTEGPLELSVNQFTPGSTLPFTNRRKLF